jgi:5-methylthioadenosine/S-adenosylhomocysteine deaminase
MPENALIIQNGIVLTMEAGASAMPGAAVVILGNRIVEICDSEGALQRYPGAKVIDAQGCAVLPGLINGHAHLRPMRALGEGMDVPVWHNKYVDGVSARMEPADAYFGAANAYLEMLRNGITTVLAMSIIEPDDMRAAVDVGIRARIARHSEHMHELEETFRLAEAQTGSEEDRVRLWLGMEWTWTWQESELKLISDTAKRLGISIHAHFSEFKVDPLEPLERTGLLRKGLILAHCVHVSESDSAKMAKAGVSVIHDPKSNMKFGSGAAPIGRYLAQGMTVGLGTDGPLSTFSCDIFEEMRTAVLLARVLSRDPAAISAERALSLATREGAVALGLEDQIGTLTPGKKADVTIVDLNGPQFRPLFVDGPLSNLISLLVFSATGRDVRDVVVDGRLVLRNRRVLTVDEQHIMAECQKRGERLLGAISNT